MPHVTFVHGISNLPVPEMALAAWRRALAKDEGIDLGAEGVTSSMVYWADVMYAAPRADVDIHESAEDELAATDDVGPVLDESMPPDERAWIDSLAARYQLDVDEDELAPPPAEADGAALERIPLPWFVKKRVMAVFLRDVHHYLFDVDHEVRPGERFRVQQEIRRRFQEAVASASGPPHIVVAHSMGTVISYDNLKRVGDSPAVDGLITVGSPLGLDEIQDKMHPEWTRDDGYPEKVERWVNIYDRFDPVAGLDPSFANDYRSGGADRVIDINEQSWGPWRHSVLKYLAGPRFREELGSMLGL
jgi:hypothetical protein